jgi:hypothetical protein
MTTSVPHKFGYQKLILKGTNLKEAKIGKNVMEVEGV